MHWFKHYPGDYLTATLRLTMQEDGAYRRLIDEYYSTEKPLPLDKVELYLIARVVSDADKAAVDKVVVRYFARTQHGYINRRIEEEIAKANKQADTNRRIAVEREAKRNKHECKDEPLHEPLHEMATYPDSRLQTLDSRHKTGSKTLVESALRFDAFWAEYPKGHKSSKKSALEKWKRKSLDSMAEKIVADIKARKANDSRWAEGFIPDVLTYINQERWTGDISSDSHGKKSVPRSGFTKHKAGEF